MPLKTCFSFALKPVKFFKKIISSSGSNLDMTNNLPCGIIVTLYSLLNGFLLQINLTYFDNKMNIEL